MNRFTPEQILNVSDDDWYASDAWHVFMTCADKAKADGVSVWGWPGPAHGVILYPSHGKVYAACAGLPAEQVQWLTTRTGELVQEWCRR